MTRPKQILVHVQGADPPITDEEQEALDAAYRLGGEEAVKVLLTAWTYGERRLMYSELNVLEVLEKPWLSEWKTVGIGPKSPHHIAHDWCAAQGLVKRKPL